MRRAIALLCVTALTSLAHAQATTSAQDQGPGHTVLGHRNPDLHEGAMQLRMGNPESGIKLTRRGLNYATTEREQYSAYSNLCAGYILIQQYENAVSYCDQALAMDRDNHQALSNRALARFYMKSYDQAQVDVDAGLQIAPHSNKLKRIAQMIRDEVDPVTPEVEVEHETP